jgi:hypothetical protein
MISRILFESETTMCMEVIVASDKPLPIISEETAFPVFQAAPLEARRSTVRRLFSKPYVCAITSLGGCACGFRYSPDDLDILTEADVPEDLKEHAQSDHEAARESVRRLKEYLRVAAQPGTVEVYSCWSGDEDADPETWQNVTLDHFGSDAFRFVERQFLTVGKESNG